MDGLALKRALLISALAVVRCPMTLAEKDKALSSAISLLDDDIDDSCDYPETGLEPYDLAVSNYFSGNTKPVE